MTPARPIAPVGRLDLRLTAPSSKSVTQRALVAASLADGTSRLRRPLLGDDGRRMIAALEAYGVPVRIRGAGDDLVVEVDGRPKAPPAAGLVLDVGDAGTAMRFLAARFAAGPVSVTLDGSARMRQRPIEDLLAALRALGADAVSIDGNGCPPVRVGGGLAGGRVSLSGALSSQFLSAILLAGPAAGRGVSIAIDGDLVSRPYVDLTLGVMRAFGARPSPAPPAAGAARFEVPPGTRYRAADLTVEGDWSSASYWFTAAAVVPGRARVGGLEPGSLQGDAGFLEVLERMGCHVARGRTEIVVEGPATPLLGVVADLRDMPDVAPSLAVAALFASGESRITGVPHLRLKETDRIAVLCEAIRRLGGEAEPLADGLVVRPRPLTGAAVDPKGDHRMAMAFAVAGLRLPGVSILDPDCVTKSYPRFWDDFAWAVDPPRASV